MPDLNLTLPTPQKDVEPKVIVNFTLRCKLPRLPLTVLGMPVYLLYTMVIIAFLMAQAWQMDKLWRTKLVTVTVVVGKVQQDGTRVVILYTCTPSVESGLAKYTFTRSDVYSETIYNLIEKEGISYEAWIDPVNPYELDRKGPRDFVRQLLTMGFLAVALFSMLWLMCVAVTRPAAAGLNHRTEPGKSIWVRVKCCEDLIQPEYIVFILCGSTLLMQQGNWALTLWIFVLLVLLIRRLKATKNHNRDISVDLETGILDVPDMTHPGHSNWETNRFSLSRVKAFSVCKLDIGPPSITLPRFLVVRLTSGQEILITPVRSPHLTIIPFSPMDIYGAQILARWLNEQLGLPQPPELLQAGETPSSPVAPSHLQTRSLQSL
ncbi:MAG: hypothetical protein ACAI35_15370 [Candidatus Methylacidiphilales bacterium]|nr:hypothetical protein [Candidatus Methylacidiphilales bacterium]